VSGLPPEAATYREGFTQTEELLALLAERIDGWGRAQWEAAVRPQLKNPPRGFGFDPPDGEVRISRPGQTPHPDGDSATNRIVTDTAEIAAFFSKP
jgi:hypothetical protein